MVSEAQKKASAKYRREHVKQIVVRLYPNEADQAVYDYLKSQPEMGKYIKRLVAEDMNRTLS